MSSKLQKLFDDRLFGLEADLVESGIMINPQKDVVEYMFLKYPREYVVYLSLFDDGEPPYRDILVSGKSKSLEVAKSIAVRKLKKKAYDSDIH